jgi:protein involved in polysaccharide export with SLBB domain
VLGDELTLSGVISQAGGLTRFGGTKVKVRRVDARSGEIEILEVNLKDVRNGKEPDLVLEPNDVVTISRRLF